MRARHDGAHTCQHCGEPVVRLQADGARQVSKWLHTPNRVSCLNVWREVLPSVAEPTAAPASVVRLPGQRTAWDVRVQGRWAA